MLIIFFLCYKILINNLYNYLKIVEDLNMMLFQNQNPEFRIFLRTY